MTDLDHVRQIVDTNRYLVLATVSAEGAPWATPVYFANDDLRSFWWISAPDSRHSRNIEAHPSIAITVFDSSVPIGGAAAMYAEATAQQCPADAIDDGIATYSRCSERDGAGVWRVEHVTAPARLRLYRAHVDALFMLAPDGGPDRSVPVALPTEWKPEPGSHGSDFH